ncbi:hypothetical protein NM208_g6770 [Fusarium decemcellulare]|uniref:Uncharacterized protein n=1 Tax=Fusarium decemcellulare TaxID=57161 RepID=A0ACC1SBV9_9HYPO|nr:hypothetical protein NM208_g6770 [Fusarium decemcellulare]
MQVLLVKDSGRPPRRVSGPHAKIGKRWLKAVGERSPWAPHELSSKSTQLHATIGITPRATAAIPRTCQPWPIELTQMAPSPGNECDYTLWRKVLAALFVSDDELSLWEDQYPEHLTLQPLELRDDPTIVFHTSFASPNPLPRIMTASRYFEWRDAILEHIASSTRLMTDSLNEFLHRYRAAHRSIAEIIAVLSDLLGNEPPEILEEYQKVAATLEALKACNDSYEDIEQMLRLRLTAHEGAIKEQSLMRKRLEELLAQYRSDLRRLEDATKRVEQDLERA